MEKSFIKIDLRQPTDVKFEVLYHNSLFFTFTFLLYNYIYNWYVGKSKRDNKIQISIRALQKNTTEQKKAEE